MSKRYELIHVRDPDAPCELRLFVDGVAVEDEEIAEVSFDPGAGYDYQEFKAGREEEIAELSPAAREVAEESLGYALESKYLENKP